MKEKIANGASSLGRLEDAKNSGGVDFGHNQDTYSSRSSGKYVCIMNICRKCSRRWRGCIVNFLCREMQGCTKPREKRTEGRGQEPQGSSWIGATC